MSVQKGLQVARRFNGTWYAPWDANDDEIGPPLWTNRIPSVEEMKQGGAVCATVPNMMLLANGKQPPKWNDWLKGGTGSYGKIYDPEYGFAANRHYEAGTLFGAPYLGERLDLQGHIAVALTSGVNPILTQSDTGLGWNEARRLHDTLRFVQFTYAVPPGEWLGKGDSPVTEEPSWGVDLADHQRGISMAQVAKEGYSFAICKASQGPGLYGGQLVGKWGNDDYKRQMRTAKEAGVMVGSYHFLLTGNIKGQVDHFLSAIGDPNGQVIAVDFENFEPAPAWSPGNDDLRAFIAELRKRIGLEHPIVVYSNKNWWEKTGVPSGPLSSYGQNLVAWDAEYLHMLEGYTGYDLYYEALNSPRYVQAWGKKWGGVEPLIWQFTSTARVAGFNLDANAFRGTAEEFRKAVIGSPTKPGIVK